MKPDFEKEYTMLVRASQRFDAGETDFIVRQLLAVKAKLMEVEYPTLLARTMIPMAADVDADAEAITWQIEDQFGEADFVSDDADDLPDVDVELGEATPTPIKTIAVQYGYSWLTLRRAAKSKAPLPSRRALRARRAVAEKIDECLRTGTPSGKVPGFLNSALITPGAATGTYDAAGLAGGMTAQKIADDILGNLDGVETDTKGLHVANTVVLPLSTYGFIDRTPWSATGQSDFTIMSYLKQRRPDVNFAKWYALEKAAANGTSKRMLVFEKNADVVEGQLPLDFYEFSPQQRGLGVKVPCVARCGGSIIRLPKAFRYVDGV